MVPMHTGFTPCYPESFPTLSHSARYSQLPPCPAPLGFEEEYAPEVRRFGTLVQMNDTSTTAIRILTQVRAEDHFYVKRLENRCGSLPISMHVCL